MRHLLSYVLFVGVPLAGLLAVLRTGQRLVAPVAVHGAYAVTPMAPSGLLCHRYLLTGGDSTLRITQSGRQLVATLGPAADVPLRGELDGTKLVLDGVIEPGTTPRHLACLAGDSLRLTAQVLREGQTKRLEAQLWTVGCDECRPLGFEAQRPRRYEGRRRA